MEKLLSRDEVADILGVSPGTLAVWACNKSQPLPFIKVGRCVRYRPGDVQDFIASQLQ